jgi:hypothetical protein
MREIILATLLAALMVPAAVSAQTDRGAPDGAADFAPIAVDDSDAGGRTPDAGATTGPPPKGGEGASGNKGTAGSSQPQDLSAVALPWMGGSGDTTP